MVGGGGEKREDGVERQVTTEAEIEMHHGSNVFVALGDELGAGKWSVRFQIRPLVNFLWLGAFIMAGGGALAGTDRRYCVARQAATAPVSTPGGAAGGGGRGRCLLFPSGDFFRCGSVPPAWT